MTIPHLVSDDKIIAAVAGPENNRTFCIGDRLHHIAHRLGVKPYGHSVLRRRLIKLEKAGKIARHSRYSAVNSIFWTLPHLKDAQP